MRSPLVYCGPMWGGKTEGLISRLVRAEIQKVRVLAFQPAQNTRDGDRIRAHSGASFPARPVASGTEILAHADHVDVVGIDEIFMIKGVVDAVRALNALGKKVVMATLDMDSDGNVWEPVGQVLGFAEEVVKCPAVCAVCKHDAYYTYRIPEAPQDRLLVGAGNFYEPRCFACWSTGEAEKKRGKRQKRFFRNTPKLPG